VWRVPPREGARSTPFPALTLCDPLHTSATSAGSGANWGAGMSLEQDATTVRGSARAVGVRGRGPARSLAWDDGIDGDLSGPGRVLR
jgi:hypothetical protein